VSPITQAILTSWQIPLPAVVSLASLGMLYWRGWRRLSRQLPMHFPPWRLGCFMAGLTLLLLAIGSPLAALDNLLLADHMLQHLLLMFAAPGLIVLGAPINPLMRGLPAGVARDALGPFLKSPGLRRCGRALTHPATCWLVLLLVNWGWHLPFAYQAALRYPAWHGVEHGCFFAAGLLFWWPVVQPWPSKSRWPRWSVVPYLLLAGFQNSLLAAILTLSGRVIYPYYDSVPRLWGISALSDQVIAGAIMWVPASLFFLLPAVGAVYNLLSPRALAATHYRRPSPMERASPEPFDLLRVPVLGALLRTNYPRRAVQGLMLLLAVGVVADGWWGPAMAPMNLAGVLPWTYWRGLLMVGLLVAGNLFCFACPFTLPRELAARVRPRGWRWPRRLRTKWIALGLLVVFFFTYELLSLWNRPGATAGLIIAYFVSAFTVDLLFSGASFCKYLCPIGNFQFAQALASPLEVRVRAPQRCTTCATHDCLRGNPSHRGCELELYLPRKVGNLDCTFCLDCVRACPHDNIGILLHPPGQNLLNDPFRSSLGRLSMRPDIVALALVVTFGAFANAAAMVGPINRLELKLDRVFGIHSLLPASALLLALGMVVVPTLAYRLAGRRQSTVQRRRMALALIPLGLAMWTAHFCFHLGAGLASGWPVMQRVLANLALKLGPGWFGPPQWQGMAPAIGLHTLHAVDLVLLDLGLLTSLYLIWRLTEAQSAPARAVLTRMMPWAVLALALYLAGTWIVMAPMQMRGMLMGTSAGATLDLRSDGGRR